MNRVFVYCRPIHDLERKIHSTLALLIADCLGFYAAPKARDMNGFVYRAGRDSHRLC